jgi:hypothetical protein
VPHEIVPVLQAFIVWHVWPAAQGEQTPALQTLSVPQLVPLATEVPVSTHSTVGEQTVVPV